MEVIIIGTGGLATELWGMLTDMGEAVLGFVAERLDYGETLHGLPILGNDDWLLDQKQLNLVIGNGTPYIRRKIYEKFCDTSHRWPSFVHPASTVFGMLVRGGGCTVMPGCVIQPSVRLGRFTHINMGVTIGHDVRIGDYCVVNHNAGISGNVKIGNEVLIGAGATILENHASGNGSIVGAGAIITKDVPAGETWISPAARPMHRSEEPPEALEGPVEGVKQATALVEVYGIS